MTIEFRCSQCNQLLRVPESAAGKSARCPKCQALMPVPTATDKIARQPGTPSGLAETSLFTPPQPAGESPFTPGSELAVAKPDGGNPFGETMGGNPFGEGGPAVTNLNPYASPAAMGYSPVATVGRYGLPWETERRTLGCWFRTVNAVLMSPSHAFTIMRRQGGLGTPIHFNIYGIGIPVVGLLIVALPLVLIFGLLEMQGEGMDSVGYLAGIMAAIVVGAAIYILAVATISQFLFSAIWHLFLMLCGGANQGFETTFRVSSYTYCSVFLPGIFMSCIPYIGGFIMMIWYIVLLIIGLSKAHEISGGKAALAVLLPFCLCFGSYVLLIVLAVSGVFD
jgi:phage FluMu protein Com